MRQGGVLLGHRDRQPGAIELGGFAEQVEVVQVAEVVQLFCRVEGVRLRLVDDPLQLQFLPRRLGGVERDARVGGNVEHRLGDARFRLLERVTGQSLPHGAKQQIDESRP